MPLSFYLTNLYEWLSTNSIFSIFPILIVCHFLMEVKNRNFKKVVHKENQKLGSRKI